MDVRALRAFVEVVRQGGFTRAGAVLHVTQPAVSRMIKALEDEAGVPLLVREARRVVLTDAGRLVFERAQAVLGSVEQIREELADLAGLRRGRLRVGLPPIIGAAFFPRVIAEFLRRHPGVSLELHEVGTQRVEALVAAHELDVGVTLLPTEEPTFEALPLARDVLLAVLHPGHPLARRRRLALRELAGTRLVMYPPDFGLHPRILNACRAAGFSPEVVSESGQWDFIAALVAANLGAALMPPPICRRLDRRQVATVPVGEPEIRWDVAIIWRRQGYVPAAVRAWNEIAARLVRGDGKAAAPGAPG